jgi:hypothetical protein
MTQNLGAPQVADNQDHKEITINDAVGRVDAALTDYLFVQVDATNTVAIAAADFKSHVQFDLSANGVTAAFTVDFPAAILRGLFVVTNSNGLGYLATLQIAGQTPTPPTLADGAIGLFFCDGASVRAV